MKMILKIPHKDAEDPCEDPVAAPDAEYLVRCCPGLLPLNMLGLQSSTESLATLQELTKLQKLCFHIEAWHRVQELSGLTGLRHLEIVAEEYQRHEKGLPVQLTELQQLTHRSCRRHVASC